AIRGAGSNSGWQGGAMRRWSYCSGLSFIRTAATDGDRPGMNRREYEIMACVEASHPWFVNRRRLVQGAVRRFLPRGATHGAGDLGARRLRVLDAGSGTGVNLLEYAAIGEAIGVDDDLAALALAARR